MINQRFNPTLLTFAQHNGGEKRKTNNRAPKSAFRGTIV